ncbi:MAG TPA: coenzyme F420-0:L-glutamate ligase [Candidatus Thermoplasmatota archaeon]|nr:coenzyme F420-0:L-glutamate ligase [Candidatus Thermoplasmatota archaeon]
MQVVVLRLPRLERRGVLRPALDGALRGAGGLRSDDILAVTSKVVSVDEGRLTDLSRVRPTKRAVALARKARMDPAFARVALDESDLVLGAVPGALLCLKGGHLIANGGADLSNAPPGFAVLWPKDPWASAERLRRWAVRRAGGPVGVVITDSHCEPLRLGTSGVALACAGFLPVEDVRGRQDLFGREMRITQRAVADGLASAAVLKMGEVDESTPAAILRDTGVRTFSRSLSNREREQATIPPEQDLFAPAYRAPLRRGAQRNRRRG